MRHDTPVGPLALSASTAGITGCYFAETDATTDTGPAVAAYLDSARRQLDAYFAGALRSFTVPVDLRRVDRRNRIVLAASAEVDYGETTTYGALADRVGWSPGASRDVGGALARNPVLVIVPCHRVVGWNGGLVGYAGGLAVKRYLLDLEASYRTPTLDLVF